MQCEQIGATLLFVFGEQATRKTTHKDVLSVRAVYRDFNLNDNGPFNEKLTYVNA